jgi:uncharacterized RDD family membrane protein YckC
MTRKYIRKSTFRVALLSRLIAKLIDTFLVLVLSFAFYPLGIIISVAYLAWSDSLAGGQSVGKSFMGFKVISLEDGAPCSLRQSVVRNLPLLIPLILTIIPLWGFILAFLLGVPLIGIELYFLFRLDSGKRMGDVLADTTVMANIEDNLDAKKQSGWFDSSKRIS